MSVYRQSGSEAQAVIDAYNRLQSVNDCEPDSDVFPDAWLDWHTSHYLPASQAWRDAVIAFQGEGGSSHPMNILPLAYNALRMESSC